MNIETLKTDLREFIQLSETIIEKPWIVDGLSLFAVGKPIVCTATPHNTVEEDASIATFIARSRNISPTMAKILLVTVEGLELCANYGQEPERGSARYDLNKLLKLWEETK